MIGWLLNIDKNIYHPINDLGMLYPSVYVTEKPKEPILGTLRLVECEDFTSMFLITPWQASARDAREGNDSRGAT